MLDLRSHFNADRHRLCKYGGVSIMSMVLEEKLVTSNRALARASAVGTSSLLRSVLLSALLTSVVCSAGVIAARSMGSFEFTQTTTITLAAIGACVCFISLPILVALFRKKQKAALVAASFVVFSMAILASVIS